MLTQQKVNIYGYVGITVMAICLALVWLQVVPQSMYLPLFLLAFVVFAGRLVLRVMLARQQKRMSNAEFEDIHFEESDRKSSGPDDTTGRG